MSQRLFQTFEPVSDLVFKKSQNLQGEHHVGMKKNKNRFLNFIFISNFKNIHYKKWNLIISNYPKFILRYL